MIRPGRDDLPVGKFDAQNNCHQEEGTPPLPALRKSFEHLSIVKND